MSRKFYCAQCGIRLITYRKPISSQGIIADLVEPHSCENFTGDEEVFKLKETPPTRKAEVNKIFEEFDFVQKINKAETESPGPKDLRPRRDELVTSSAPMNTLSATKVSTPSTPVNNSGGFEDE